MPKTIQHFVIYVTLTLMFLLIQCNVHFELNHPSHAIESVKWNIAIEKMKVFNAEGHEVSNVVLVYFVLSVIEQMYINMKRRK